jgi:Flp pilus assembly protein TadD
LNELTFASLRALCLSFAFAACTSGAPAKNPDDTPPALDATGGAGNPGPVEPASSAKVKDGIAAIQAGDFAKAKEILSAAEAEAPKDAQAAFYLGVALEKTGDTDGAVTKYNKALELDPKLTEAAVNLSALLLDRNRAKEAVTVVEAALGRAPNHPMLLMNRALALEAAGDTAGALRAYGAAVQAQPDNAELRYAHAELLAGAGKKDEALAELRKLIGTDDPRLAGAAAKLLDELGAAADCVSALDKAVKNKPNPELYTRRGICRHKAKDDVGAKSDYEAAIALDPKYAPAHFYLGMHYKNAGKKKEAERSLAKAVELAGGKGIGEAAKKALDELAKGK